MSNAQQQSAKIEELFNRYDELSSRMQEFKRAYMTPANPTVQTVQEPVHEPVHEPVQDSQPVVNSTDLVEQFDNIKGDAAELNNIISDINVDDLFAQLDLDARDVQTQSVPNAEKSADEIVKDINIDDILASVDIDIEV